MSISPVCGKCGKELNEPGAVLFSPADENNMVKKFPICRDCYGSFANSFAKQKIFKKLDY